MQDFRAIDWSPHSFEDPGGRIFWQDKRLFRALRGKSAKAFINLEHNDLLEELTTWNVVGTKRTDIKIEGFELVVEHDVLPASSLVHEWSPTMLLDAALLFCNLSKNLASVDMQLQDSHGWNIMFHYGNPVYVDFGSIIPILPTETWMPFEEFIHCFLNPLKLISHNQIDYAFYLLGTNNSISLEETIPFISKLQFRLFRKLDKTKYDIWNKFIIIRKGKRSIQKSIDILIKEINKCNISNVITRWSSYSDGFCSPIIQNQSSWNIKQQNVYKILSHLKTGKLLDLGCNTGWYSILAASMGFEVVAMDKDRVCIDSLYKKIKENQLKITPVVSTPFSPILPCSSRFYQSLEQRFICDYTLMLALIHHLFFKQGYSVESIIKIAASFTKKTLIIEYVPIEDYWIKQWNILYRTDEYSLENWIVNIKKYFTDITIFNSEFSHSDSVVDRKIIVASI
jgi:hypothetical protein